MLQLQKGINSLLKINCILDINIVCPIMHKISILFYLYHSSMNCLQYLHIIVIFENNKTRSMKNKSII